MALYQIQVHLRSAGEIVTCHILLSPTEGCAATGLTKKNHSAEESGSGGGFNEPYVAPSGYGHPDPHRRRKSCRPDDEGVLSVVSREALLLVYLEFGIVPN